MNFAEIHPWALETLAGSEVAYEVGAEERETFEGEVADALREHCLVCTRCHNLREVARGVRRSA